MSVPEVHLNDDELHQLDNQQLAALLAQLNEAEANGAGEQGEAVEDDGFGEIVAADVEKIEEKVEEKIEEKVEEIAAKIEEVPQIIAAKVEEIAPKEPSKIAALLAEIGRCEIEANIAFFKIRGAQHGQDRLSRVIATQEAMIGALGSISAAVHRLAGIEK